MAFPGLWHLLFPEKGTWDKEPKNARKNAEENTDYCLKSDDEPARAYAVLSVGSLSNGGLDRKALACVDFRLGSVSLLTPQSVP